MILNDAEFRQRGIFIIRGYLEPAICMELRAEALQVTAKKSQVVRGNCSVLDERARKSVQIKTRHPQLPLLASSLEQLLPILSEQMGVELSTYQAPQLLHYKKGDFFKPHQDNSPHPSSPAAISNRKVTVVIFLSNESRQLQGDGTYTGGQLVFYRLFEKPTWDNCRLPFRGTEGTLVAFRSNIFHEVACVNEGDRFTVVSWLT